MKSPESIPASKQKSGSHMLLKDNITLHECICQLHSVQQFLLEMSVLVGGSIRCYPVGPGSHGHSRHQPGNWHSLSNLVANLHEFGKMGAGPGKLAGKLPDRLKVKGMEFPGSHF